MCLAVLLVEKYLVTDILSQLLLRPISNESTKDMKKPLVAGSKDPSATQGNSEDPGSGPPEAKPVASISSTQLVFVVADLDRLQQQVGRVPGTPCSLRGFLGGLCEGRAPSAGGLRPVGPRGGSREHLVRLPRAAPPTDMLSRPPAGPDSDGHPGAAAAPPAAAGQARRELSSRCRHVSRGWEGNHFPFTCPDISRQRFLFSCTWKVLSC